MSDLVEFIKARLDEDEQAARSCPQPHWVVSGPPSGHYAHSSTSSTLNGWSELEPNRSTILAEPTMRAGRSLHHAARHDPARVLREVEAKRRIVNEYVKALKIQAGSRETDAEIILRETLELACWAFVMSYADHPDCCADWKP